MAKKPTALTGATIINGKGEIMRGNVLLMVDGKIAGVVSEVPEGFEAVDFSGKYITPGLIEMHGHFYGRSNFSMASQHRGYMPLYLAGGITTVRTPGEFRPFVSRRLKDEVDKELAVGPRIMTAGEYIDHFPSIVRWIHGVDSAEDAVQRFKDQKDDIDFVKVYSSMPAEWIKAVCDAAHAEGFKVYGHLGASTTEDAILAGINGVEHGIYTMTEFAEIGENGRETRVNFDPYGDKASGVIDLIIKHDVAITPTTSTFVLSLPEFTTRINDLGLWKYYSPEAAKKLSENRVKMESDPNEVRDERIMLEKQYQFIERIYKAGGRVFCGTDPSYVLLTPGYAIVWEAQYLRGCGMTAKDIMAALTGKAALELGISNITGDIRPGLDADLAVFDRNPLENVDNLYSINKVLKRGVMYDSAELRKSAEGSIGC